MSWKIIPPEPQIELADQIMGIHINHVRRIIGGSFTRTNSPTILRVLTAQWFRRLGSGLDDEFRNPRDLVNTMRRDLEALQERAIPSILFMLQELEIDLLPNKAQEIATFLSSNLTEILSSLQRTPLDEENPNVRIEFSERLLIGHLSRFDPESATIEDINLMRTYAQTFMAASFDMTGEVRINNVLASMANLSWLAYIVPQAVNEDPACVQHILTLLYGKFMSLVDQKILLLDGIPTEYPVGEEALSNQYRKLTKNILNVVNNFLILGFVPTALELPVQVAIDIIGLKNARAFINKYLVTELMTEKPTNTDALAFWERMLGQVEEQKIKPPQKGLLQEGA
ncbi:MAG: hypothetical protein JNK26_04255 [Candidatus Doudnabacteria bacterium]|nr:hypothetical protein [Candidatus Doudnabacteria bacterium]